MLRGSMRSCTCHPVCATLYTVSMRSCMCHPIRATLYTLSMHTAVPVMLNVTAGADAEAAPTIVPAQFRLATLMTVRLTKSLTGSAKGHRVQGRCR